MYAKRAETQKSLTRPRFFRHVCVDSFCGWALFAEMSSALGINVNKFFIYTFTFGCLLGCLGGAVSAPMISVVPGIGVEVIVLAFAVVVTGGLGSVSGAAIGALFIGIARTIAIFYAIIIVC